MLPLLMEHICFKSKLYKFFLKKVKKYFWALIKNNSKKHTVSTIILKIKAETNKSIYVAPKNPSNNHLRGHPITARPRPPSHQSPVRSYLISLTGYTVQRKDVSSSFSPWSVQNAIKLLLFYFLRGKKNRGFLVARRNCSRFPLTLERAFFSLLPYITCDCFFFSLVSFTLLWSVRMDALFLRVCVLLRLFRVQ